MNGFINIAKALSDPNRVRALMALIDSELCVCQVVELLDLAPSTVSKHMSILKQAGLVESNKNGRWVYYSLPIGENNQMIHGALELLKSSLSEEPQIIKDAIQMQKILKSHPVELC